MKNVFLLLHMGLFLLVAGPFAQSALAQRQIGWYAGPTAAVTQFNDEVGVLTGIEGGVIFNQRLTIGLETYRLLNNIEADRPDDAGRRNTEFFYSGLSVAYVFPVTDRLNVEPRALIGGGEAHWRKGFWDGAIGDWRRDDRHTTSLVLVPGADVSYTLTPWLRATMGADYRFVTAGKSEVLNQSDMNGLTGSIGLRFGRF